MAGLGALLLTVLGACGGGGGGGAGSSTQVEMTVVDGASSQAYVGQQVPSLVLSFRITGDLTVFRNAPLLLVIEVSDPSLFEATPFVSIASDGVSGIAQLVGKFGSATAGVHAGNAVVHACLGLQCTTELKVAGATIPYQITIKPGVSTATDRLTMSAPFGSLPSDVVLPVSLPDGATSWSVSPQSGLLYGYAVPHKATDGSNALVFAQTELAPAGYSGIEQVIVSAVTPDGQTLSTLVTIDVSTLP
jgi:hypothetical protein